jgi:hypothetical protein
MSGPARLLRGAVWTAAGACVLGLWAGCAGNEEPPSDPVVLSFLPPGERCDSNDATVPSPDEYGDFGAARIQFGEAISGRSFAVEEVRYVLEGFNPAFPDFPCDARLDHEVWVWVTDAATPPPDATGARIFPVSPGDERPASFSRPIELMVDPPLIVEDGQELFVAVEFPGTEDGYQCLRNCPQVGSLNETHNFWSNRTQEALPFAWTPISEFGLNYGFEFFVEGRYKSP